MSDLSAIFGENRVTRAIDQLRARLASLDDDTLAKLTATTTLDFGEHFAYQQAQANAHASGRLTVDEAQVVYVALGEVGDDANGGWASGTDLATKIAVTKLIAELHGR